MKRWGFRKFCLLLLFALFIGTFFMPDWMGDSRAMIAAFAGMVFIVILLSLIVSWIRAKIRTRNRKPTPAPAPAQAVVIPQKTKEKKPTTIERVHVRGVDHYTSNIRSVAGENPDYDLTKRELQEEYPDERVWQYQFFVKAALVPEPDNEYDPNAIMVQADGLCIGHVPAGSTAHVRKLMESGRIKYLDLKIGGGKYKEAREVDDGEYELERGESSYSAVLEIHLTEANNDLSQM